MRKVEITDLGARIIQFQYDQVRTFDPRYEPEMIQSFLGFLIKKIGFNYFLKQKPKKIGLHLHERYLLKAAIQYAQFEEPLLNVELRYLIRQL